jgi:signal transduction histidine kinase
MTFTLRSLVAEMDCQDNISHVSHSRKAAAPEGSVLLSPPTGSDRQYTSCNLLHAQKMAALGELASGITHDFRNILQIVISTLDVIESRSGDPTEVRRLTASALRASERGIGLTKRLLKFSRFEAADPRPISLLVSLESAAETLARTIEARMNVEIEPLPAELWPVIIDPMEFELALINLGINARDAMPHGGRIRLGARNVTIPHVDRRVTQVPIRPDQIDNRGPSLPLPSGDYVMVVVDDTGHGMDAATLGRAMEPFFTTKPLDKGTGLGLSTVHSLTRHAQGALRLISKLGQGTTVQLWLPRAHIDRG